MFGGTSDAIHHTTMSLSMEQAGNLHDPDSPEWEDGYVTLVDGQQMQLWSVFAPAPTMNHGESQAAFATWQRAAWQK